MKTFRLGLLAAALLVAGGCGGSSTENLSARASDDPAKLQTARDEAAKAAEKAKQDEAKTFKGAIKVEP